MKTAYKTSPKIILSGGGTGGHIFPAIAIADEIKKRFPQAEILFVGAMGKMEMEKVPRAGYSIRGISIAGINRENLVSNYKFPFQLANGLCVAMKIINEFSPDVVVGTGGYASGPTLLAAQIKGKPTIIQEQNSHAGITNKWLAKRANAICVAYEGMEKFFPVHKIKITGNPIREQLISTKIDAASAKLHFGLDPNKITLLSVGGSQGSRRINNAWSQNIDKFLAQDIQLIWQTGSLDFDKIIKNETVKSPKIYLTQFIDQMDIAYAAADWVVSRAGAIAISELAALGKACVLVPLPTAAADHQTQNTIYLTDRNAAYLLPDALAEKQLVDKMIELSKQKETQKSFSQNLQLLAKPNATKEIVDEIIRLI